MKNKYHMKTYGQQYNYSTTTETNNGTTSAMQQPACQWTDWKEMFSAGSAPMTAHGTMDTIRSSVFYAICAEG
jgi:hypothetical protein